MQPKTARELCEIIEIVGWFNFAAAMSMALVLSILVVACLFAWAVLDCPFGPGRDLSLAAIGTAAYGVLSSTVLLGFHHMLDPDRRASDNSKNR